MFDFYRHDADIQKKYKHIYEKEVILVNGDDDQISQANQSLLLMKRQSTLFQSSNADISAVSFHWGSTIDRYKTIGSFETCIFNLHSTNRVVFRNLFDCSRLSSSRFSSQIQCHVLEAILNNIQLSNSCIDYRYVLYRSY